MGGRGILLAAALHQTTQAVHRTADPALNVAYLANQRAEQRRQHHHRQVNALHHQQNANAQRAEAKDGGHGGTHPLRQPLAQQGTNRPANQHGGGIYKGSG